MTKRQDILDKRAERLQHAIDSAVERLMQKEKHPLVIPVLDGGAFVDSLCVSPEKESRVEGFLKASLTVSYRVEDFEHGFALRLLPERATLALMSVTTLQIIRAYNTLADWFGDDDEPATPPPAFAVPVAAHEIVHLATGRQVQRMIALLKQLK